MRYNKHVYLADTWISEWKWKLKHIHRQIAKTPISRMQALFHQVPLNEVYGDQAAEKLSPGSPKSQGYIQGTLSIILRQNGGEINIKKQLRKIYFKDTTSKRWFSYILDLHNSKEKVYANMKLRLRSFKEGRSMLHFYVHTGLYVITTFGTTAII